MRRAIIVDKKPTNNNTPDQAVMVTLRITPFFRMNNKSSYVSEHRCMNRLRGGVR